MAEEVVHHVDSESNNSGMGFFLGIIILVVFLVLIIFYGFPYLRNISSGGTQINVPDKINVNVNQEPPKP